MKIFDKKNIFTCVNAEDADHYRLTSGYFADDLSELNEKVKSGNLEELHLILQDIFTNRFFANNRAFALFLPADKVKETKEQKYRPFKTFKEFCDTVRIEGVGDFISFKVKGTPSPRYHVILNGYGEYKEQLVNVSLGAFIYTPEQLFDTYEIQVEGEWQPFGVLENE